MQFATSGYVKDGTLYIRNRKRMNESLAPWRDCEVTITVERSHATRSKAQNDFYHAVVVKLVADHTGYDPKEMHEVLKAMHLPRELAERGVNGRMMNGLVVGGTTTKLNKLEFIEYLETIVRWAAEELHVVIPDPDPDWRAKATAERTSEAA